MFFGNLGIVYGYFGDFLKVIECFLKVFEIRKSIGDKEGEVIYFGNLGVVYYVIGKYVKVVEYYEKVF